MLRFASPLLVLALAAPLPAQDAGGFFFRAGDRVCFLGDSITEQYQYSSDIELYLTTRFPAWKLTFVNAGIGGDTATGGARRFDKHVLAEKPTCVTINFGMNDGGYAGFDAPRHANYVKNTEAMLEAAKKAGVRVALISPNAVEVRNKRTLERYLETQKEFYAPLAEIADRFHLPFVNQYAVTRGVIEKLDADMAKVKPFPDAVHTSSAGGLLMAHTILVGLKAPALVSAATVNVADRSADGTRCRVKVLNATPEAVSFERTDEALPLPIQKDWRDLLPYLDDLKNLNQYNLTVKGLADGKYDLRIDDKECGQYTKDALAAGVNLGNLGSGPLHDHGQKVFDAINAKNKIVHERFRKVVMFDPKSLPDWIGDVTEKRETELVKRSAAIAAKEVEIERLARPKTHTFELTVAK